MRRVKGHDQLGKERLFFTATATAFFSQQDDEDDQENDPQPHNHSNHLKTVYLKKPNNNAINP